MNRKDRRAARSKGKGGPGGAQGLGPGAMSANLFASAIQHFNAGRLDDAERLCRDVLMFDRSHFDAMHMIGIIATRVGNLAAAAELFGRALAVNARSAECHFNIAQVFRAQGRNRDAIDHLGAATAIKRNYVAAHLSLGEMLLQQNAFDEARSSYEQALAADPRQIDARHGLAHVLRQQGRLDEAAAQFRQVVALKPDFAEAYNNLGTVLAAQGRWAEAADEYRRAISLKPELLDVHRNLARALLTNGHADEALQAVMRGLAIGETDDAKFIFVQCAQGLASIPPDERFRELVGRALTEGWGRSGELAPLAAFLFISGETGGAAMQRVFSASLPEQAVDAGLFASLSDDRLFLALLESAPVRNHALEQFLTVVRSGVLRLAAEASPDSPVEEHSLAVACALARQCFINEYVFFEPDGDTALLAELRQRIEASLASGAAVVPLRLAALGTFVPLHGLPQAVALTERHWPQPLHAVLAQQVQEPAAERAIAAAIPVLTPIEDAVSIRVRDQYEEMPYPRWVKPTIIGSPTTLDWYLRSQFPGTSIGSAQNPDGLDVLVAGCGTGQHAIETAQRFTGARVLAVDLSRASLAYAARKTREAKLRNIEYMQADILNLGGLNARFDLIEASGVLHHMREPTEGWRVLVSLLKPGGFMNIGLYSAAARSDISATRALIIDRGYQETASDIRRCRQELLGFEDGTPFKNVTNYSDFFTTGECRDLLFHVQERQFTIPEIKDFLGQNGLAFLGFTGPAVQAYRARFPDDAALTDLDQWHVFETENPMAFVNMYQFWVRKVI